MHGRATQGWGNGREMAGGIARRRSVGGDGERIVCQGRLEPGAVPCLPVPQPDAEADGDLQSPLPHSGDDALDGEEPGGLSLRASRCAEGNHDADERAGGRLYLRDETARPKGTPLDVVLPAADTERRLFRRPDVQGRGDVRGGRGCGGHHDPARAAVPLRHTLGRDHPEPARRGRDRRQGRECRMGRLDR